MKHDIYDVKYAWAFQPFYELMLKVFKTEEVTFEMAQLLMYFFRVSFLG